MLSNETHNKMANAAMAYAERWPEASALYDDAERSAAHEGVTGKAFWVLFQSEQERARQYLYASRGGQ